MAKIVKGKKKKRDQCFVFEVKIFKSKRAVKLWLSKKDIKIPRNSRVKKFDDKFRVKMRDCCRFKKLRETKLKKGVCVVRGFLK